MDKVFSVLASPLSFIVLISVIITVHELGHYWVGRIFNAAAESFAIGFGKPIFEVRDKRGTRWRLNWLPLGGFVKFVGEIQAPTDTREQRPDTPPGVDITEIEEDGKPPIRLIGKPYTELGPWKRMAVSLGGPFANFIFAIVVFAVMAMGFGVATSKEVLVTGVDAGGPAAAAGFKPGDLVIEAGGKPVVTSNDIERATVLMSGEEVHYTVLRAGQKVDLVATPKSQTDYNEQLKVRENLGRIGLKLAQRDTAIRKLNPIEAIGYGVTSTGDAIESTITVLRRLVTGRDGLDKLSGPLGIFNLADNVTDMHMKQEGVSLDKKLTGLLYSFVNLAALLSIGVGFFNLLPIPVLDGGAVVMCVAEAITGKEVPEKVQQVGLTIGLACLVSFALVITWQDIGRLVPGWPGAP